MKFALMFGGNLGDVAATFDFAAAELESFGVRNLRRSAIHRSAAVDCAPGTPEFGDQAAVGEYAGSAAELFRFLRELERRCGRPAKHSSRESRTLDCDLIFWGNESFSTPELTVPHPRARRRRFVLIPLAEVAPDWRFPDGVTVAEALLRTGPED